MTVSVHVFELTTKTAYFDTVAGLRKLATIESELDVLCEIASDRLHSVFGFRIVQLGTSIHRLEIVSAPVTGNLLDLLAACQELKESRALQLLEQVLQGLQHLQRHRLLHRGLNLRHVLLSGDGTVTLLGSSYIQRLLDLNRSADFYKAQPLLSLPMVW